MAEYILETKGLGISFGGLKAAQDVNIKIRKNQIYGLIGPNGAGKTTIFNLLTGEMAVLQDLLYALILISIVIYNNAPALAATREKYNIAALLHKVFKPKHDPAHRRDDKAKWDVVPTKISMDEILSVDMKPQNLSADKNKGGKH